MRRNHNKSQALKTLDDIALKCKLQKYPNVRYPIPPKYTDKTTNDLTRCVIHFLTMTGNQAERINSMGRQIKHNGQTKWIYGSHTKGTADISATIKGKSVKIEIKCKATNDNIQSIDQKRYQETIEKAGGIYIIVRDFQTFYDWYLKFVADGR